MWIAKPVSALSAAEREAWVQVCEDRLRRTGEAVPLSQTLTWASGISAVSGKAYLVFSPEQRVGGLVFATVVPDGERRGTHFECVNGPLLDWDDRAAVAPQLGTFAMGVAKLAEPGKAAFPFRSLVLRPRWEKERAAERLSFLPIPAATVDEAATIQVPIESSLGEQQARLRSRLRRTLAGSSRLPAEREWREGGLGELSEFVPKMREFGEKKGFSVPPLEWFRGLCLNSELSKLEGISFWIGKARMEGVESEILVCIQGSQAHYLFGRESREEGARAALSASALNQWGALSRFVELGLKYYDLNGYVVDARDGHPYAGVCRFKEQFGGEVLEYRVPEFRIE